MSWKRKCTRSSSVLFPPGPRDLAGVSGVSLSRLQRRKILILGAGGRLGARLTHAYGRDHAVQALGRKEADLGRPEQLAELLRAADPEVVINCAAMTNVDACETERELAETVNAVAPGVLGQVCSSLGARLIHVSTDYVFSGENNEPYNEQDVPRPLSWYGETKRRGEENVMESDPRHAVVRVAWVFGPDRDSFIDKALHTAMRGETVRAVADKYSSPTYTLDAAAALAGLLADEAAGGIYHLCNRGVCSWREWAQAGIDAAIRLGVPIRAPVVEPIKLSDLAVMKARRPIHTVLACGRLEALLGQPMRSWPEAVADYVRLLRDEGRITPGAGGSEGVSDRALR